MFEYNSMQTHTEFKNGKGHIRTNRVTIKGKSGYKMITIRNKSGRVTKKSKKRLSRNVLKNANLYLAFLRIVNNA